MSKKELKIEFAPGSFDSFEGTQEELNELIAQIQEMFKGKTAEEIEALSHPLTDEEFDELPEDVQRQLLSYDEEEQYQPNRKLQ